MNGLRASDDARFVAVIEHSPMAPMVPDHLYIVAVEPDGARNMVAHGLVSVALPAPVQLRKTGWLITGRWQPVEGGRFDEVQLLPIPGAYLASWPQAVSA